MGKGVVGVMVAEFSSHSTGEPKELIDHFVPLLQSARTRKTFRLFRDSSFAQLNWNSSRSRGTSSRDMSGAPPGSQKTRQHICRARHCQATVASVDSSSFDLVVRGLGLEIVEP